MAGNSACIMSLSRWQKPIANRTVKLVSWAIALGSGTSGGTLAPLLTGSGREHHGNILRQATLLANTGQLRPLLDPHSFNLGNVLDAYTLIDQRGARGKLVVEIN